MTPTIPFALTATLAAAACATAGSSSRFHQADHAAPARSQFSDDSQRAMIDDAISRLARADQAEQAGNQDQARAESGAAAERLVKFADTFTESDWRIVLRMMAAERYRKALEWEKAAGQAQNVFDDPQANDVSRALASLSAAGAWQQLAMAEGRAGRIHPPRLLAADKRKGEALRPQAPPHPWKRYIENADRYVTLTQGLSAAELQQRGWADPAQLAVIAAEVELGYDNAEDARRRYEAILPRWSSRADVLEQAVPWYLQTFLATRDGAGYEAAVARLLVQVRAEAAKAAAGGSGEQKKAAEKLARLESELARQQQAAGFSAAEGLLTAEKYPEAAAAFEKFAAENPDHLDAPNALYNAGVAFDKGREPRKALAARERLLQRYPDAKVAPQATLAQAQALSRQGDHAGAQKAYQAYLGKWSQGPQRCLVLYNLGVELQTSGKKLEAARSYQTFARERACVAEEPNNAATVIFNAAQFFGAARKKADALEMWQVLAGLEGVSAANAKSFVEEAKRRVKRGGR